MYHIPERVKRGKFRKLLHVRRSAFLSVRSSVFLFVGTTELTKDGFSWNFTFEYFSEISQKFNLYSNLTRIKGMFIRTNVHLWEYLADFFLEWEMFQTEVVGWFKIQILCLITFFRKSCPSWNNVEKYNKVIQAQMKILRMRIACWIPKATNMLSEYVILVAFQLQQWLNKHTSMLRYTYVDCLVSFERCCIYLSVFTCFLLLFKKQLFVHNFLQIETLCVLCEVVTEYLYFE